jgi:two-component system chemotaxis response regulator CheB
MRQYLSELVAGQPSMEVVGTAPNGEVALKKIPQVSPDLVVLDVEMPVMDGLQTLEHIRKTMPKLPVIMFSSVMVAGSPVTVEALTLGATDYVTKPSATDDRDQRGAELVDKIVAITGGAKAASKPENGVAAAVLPTRKEPVGKVDVIAIGASTGGPNAVAEVLKGLGGPLPVPIVIVQHMPASFTALFADRLSRESGIPVKEGIEGAELKPGTAWLAPGGYHMTLSRKLSTVRLHLNEDPPVHSCRPSVDVMFESMEVVYRQRVLAVVLTGMGEDGLTGATALSDAGASVVVQDEATSVVWGMAGAVAKAGVANKILPLSDVAREISRRAHYGR